MTSQSSSRRFNAYVGTDKFLRMVGRMLRSGGKRVAEGDVEELADLIALRTRLDESIVEAVRGLRAAGCTWEVIGEATGTTRQAAIQKWARKV